MLLSNLRKFQVEKDASGTPQATVVLEATLLRSQSAANKLLDHVDGWQKVYSDDIATIHVRTSGAAHTAEPAVDSKAK